jgi:carboxyl-terminal processing protease
MTAHEGDEMKRKFKKILAILLSLTVIFYSMSFFFVGFDTRNILYNFDPVRLFEKISEARKFSDIRQIIINEYVDSVDDDKMLKDTYNAMVGSLGDKYAAYFTKDELENYLNNREGAFGGIGVNVTADYGKLTITVTGFMDGSPAFAAGMEVGDHIISADGATFTDKTTMKNVMDLIPGKEGTVVAIGVQRAATGEDLMFNIEREKIYVNNTAKEMIGDIGYIRIIRFTTGVSKDFIDACEWLKANGAQSLIVDVRGNGGGSLDEVIKISDHLLGDVLIVYTEDRYGVRRDHYSDSILYDIPLAVLTDRSSASASELFAGAMQDNGRGHIFGQTTFGKGIVQTDYYLFDGTGIKITTSKYYLPSGKSIHGIGITPDYTVDQGDGYKGFAADGLPGENDSVLDRALEYLRQ